MIKTAGLPSVLVEEFEAPSCMVGSAMTARVPLSKIEQFDSARLQLMLPNVRYRHGGEGKKSRNIYRNQINRGIKASAGFEEECAQQDSPRASLCTRNASRLRTTILRFRSAKAQVWKVLKHGREMLEWVCAALTAA